eukprot:352209-Chlamydomonas_euryale.AAC.9
MPLPPPRLLLRQRQLLLQPMGCMLVGQGCSRPQSPRSPSSVQPSCQQERPSGLERPHLSQRNPAAAAAPCRRRDAHRAHRGAVCSEHRVAAAGAAPHSQSPAVIRAQQTNTATATAAASSVVAAWYEAHAAERRSVSNQHCVRATHLHSTTCTHTARLAVRSLASVLASVSPPVPSSVSPPVPSS